MRKTLIGIIVVLAASALGVGVAASTGPYLRAWVSPAYNSGILQTSQLAMQRSAASEPSQAVVGPQADATPAPTPVLRPGAAWYYGDDWCVGDWSSPTGQGWRWQGALPGAIGGRGWRGMGAGMMGSWGRSGMGASMMGGWGWTQLGSNSERMAIEDAVEAARSYLARYGSGLEVAEVMEFGQNFYAVVREADTGRGAFELLIDPYTGAVSSEVGPNMMWNFKYSPMGGGAGDSTITAEEARLLAQQALDANLPGAVIEGEGTAFYGYFTFDYAINGQVAGMLSVNGLTGDTWPHTWHGEFMREEEL